MKRTNLIIKYLSQLIAMKLGIDELTEKAQDKYDSLSDKQVDGEKGESLQSDIEKLEELQSSIDGLCEEIETAFESD